MSSHRTKGREYALQVLYDVDTSGKDPEAALESFFRNFESTPGQGTPDPAATRFAEELVNGVGRSRDELDALIERCSINWRLDRMPRVDRNVLRLSCWELVHAKDVPKKVVINEAIELGKRFGSEESGSFINGILDKVAAEVGRE